MSTGLNMPDCYTPPIWTWAYIKKEGLHYCKGDDGREKKFPEWSKKGENEHGLLTMCTHLDSIKTQWESLPQERQAGGWGVEGAENKVVNYGCKVSLLTWESYLMVRWGDLLPHISQYVHGVYLLDSWPAPQLGGWRSQYLCATTGLMCWVCTTTVLVCWVFTTPILSCWVGTYQV